MGEYIEQFEQYDGLLKGIQQDYLMGSFLNGLKEEIKAEVKLYEPKNLTEIMMKAQMVVERLESPPREDLSWYSVKILISSNYHLLGVILSKGEVQWSFLTHPEEVAIAVAL